MENKENCVDAVTNFEKGGKEYYMWASSICRIMCWDCVNSDINFMNEDWAFDMWRRGDTVKDVISRLKSSVNKDYYINRYNKYMDGTLI